MSESTTPDPVGFMEKARRCARSAGNIAFVLSLITVVLATVADEIQETAPCWEAPFAAVAAGWLISTIAALGIGVIAILAGLITLRVRAIASGVASFLIIGALISATIRSDASRTLDAAARARLRTINTAEVMHRGQAQRFGSIEDLIRLGLVDSGIRSGYGYKFTLSADENDYTAKATSASKYGCWDYSSKSDGVVRYSADQSRAPKGQSGQPVP